MVALVQVVFQEWWLAEEATCQEVNIIPKGGEEYRDIRIVEVLWKLVTVILDCGSTASIAFYDALHGFQAGYGTGTASLDSKLLQQLMAKR